MTIGIVANDAGGAELLAAFVAEYDSDYMFTLAGPAVEIFKRKFGAIRNLPLESTVRNSDKVITGTGWQTDLEWNAIRLSLSAGIAVAALLDSWENYEARFERNSQSIFPNEMWVVDEIAKNIAESTFPNIPVRLISLESRYSSLIAEYSNMRGEFKQEPLGKVLFISDNISDAVATQGLPDRGYTDLGSLEFLLMHLSKLPNAIEPITIRPHPSESIMSWQATIAAYQGRLRLSSTSNLIQEFAEHEFVVGSNSNALVKAAICGKKTFSAIPNTNVSTSLPEMGIQLLRDLV